MAHSKLKRPFGFYDLAMDRHRGRFGSTQHNTTQHNTVLLGVVLGVCCPLESLQTLPGHCKTPSIPHKKVPVQTLPDPT